MAGLGSARPAAHRRRSPAPPPGRTSPRALPGWAALPGSAGRCRSVPRLDGCGQPGGGSAELAGRPGPAAGEPGAGVGRRWSGPSEGRGRKGPSVGRGVPRGGRLRGSWGSPVG